MTSAGETTLVGTLYTQLTRQVGDTPDAVRAALDGANLRAMATAYLEGIENRVPGASLRVIDEAALRSPMG